MLNISAHTRAEYMYTCCMYTGRAYIVRIQYREIHHRILHYSLVYSTRYASVLGPFFLLLHRLVRCGPVQSNLFVACSPILETLNNHTTPRHKSLIMSLQNTVRTLRTWPTQAFILNSLLCTNHMFLIPFHPPPWLQLKHTSYPV